MSWEWAFFAYANNAGEFRIPLQGQMSASDLFTDFESDSFF